MKFSILLALIFLVINYAVAQDNEAEIAYKQLKAGELIKAKEAIDKAIEDKGLQVKHKTWRYRAKVYLAIAQSDKEEHEKLSYNPLQEMFSAYVKAQDYGLPDSEYSAVAEDMKVAKKMAKARAEEAFEAKDYKKAVSYYEVAIQTGNYLVEEEPELLYKAGLASELRGKYRTAARYYQRCVNEEYKANEMYVARAAMLRAQDKNEKAEEYLKEGAAKFPDDHNLLATLISNYQTDGENVKAMLFLQEFVVKNPDKPVAHYLMGSVYNSQGLPDKAEISFLKAIELHPDYFNPNYDLGAIYFNTGALIVNNAKDAPEQEYESARATAAEIFEKARTYFEKAHELRPSEQNTMLALKQIYIQLDMAPEFQAMQEKLEKK